jgi:hypothetical protein
MRPCPSRVVAPSLRGEALQPLFPSPSPPQLHTSALVYALLYAYFCEISQGCKSHNATPNVTEDVSSVSPLDQETPVRAPTQFNQPRLAYIADLAYQNPSPNVYTAAWGSQMKAAAGINQYPHKVVTLTLPSHRLAAGTGQITWGANLDVSPLSFLSGVPLSPFPRTLF